MITEQTVINTLRRLPLEQKNVIAAHSTLYGVSIEKRLVPTITNLLRGIEVMMQLHLENRRFLNQGGSHE